MDVLGPGQPGLLTALRIGELRSLKNRSSPEATLVSRSLFLLPKCRLIGLTAAFLACGATGAAQDMKSPQRESGGIIAGVVYLPEGDQAGGGVNVNFRSHDATVISSALTDRDGHFEVGGLAPGEYEIRIEEQGYQAYQSTTRFNGSPLNLELHLARIPPASRGTNTISLRELTIPPRAREDYTKGLLSLEKKEFAKSLKHFSDAVRIFPGYFEAFYHRGIAEASLNHPEAAMQSFQAASDLSGGRYALALFGMAYLHYVQEDAAQAEILLREGLELEPDSAHGYAILAMVLLRLNRPEEAEKSAREALARDPDKPDPYLVLADVYGQVGNYQQQIQYLDSYLKLAPDGAASKRVREVRDAVCKVLGRVEAQK